MDIVFNAKSFDNKTPIKEEEKATYISTISFLFQHFKNELNLANLKSITITDEYFKELSTFCSDNNLTDFPTDNQYGSAFGCVKSLQHNNETYYHVFIKKELILSLIPDYCLPYIKETISEDNYKQLLESRQFAINIINHEFAHIHENNLSKEITWINDYKKEPQKLQSLYMCFAQSVWGEYFANRKASSSYPFSETDIIELPETIKNIENDIINKRHEYNLWNLSIDDFIYYFLENTSFIMKKVASIHGNIFLFNQEEREEIIVYLEGKLESTRMQTLLCEIGVALDKLYSLFPKWESEIVFNEMITIITTYFARFHVYPIETPEGIYYSIPYLT